MRKEGTIVRWDDARGFGFIRSTAAGAEVFLHIRDFRAPGASGPREGLRVVFDEIHVGGKGPRAMAVHLASPPAAAALPTNPSPPVRPSAAMRHPPRRVSSRPRTSVDTPASGGWVALPLMLVYAAALLWAVWYRHLPWWVLPASVGLNAATFFAYWQDKYAAGTKGWRISERSLHVWSLAGGWGGAWFAQQVLRHKSRKQSFREVYWATVILHCAVLAGWLWSFRLA